MSTQGPLRLQEDHHLVFSQYQSCISHPRLRVSLINRARQIVHIIDASLHNTRRKVLHALAAGQACLAPGVSCCTAEFYPCRSAWNIFRSQARYSPRRTYSTWFYPWCYSVWFLISRVFVPWHAVWRRQALQESLESKHHVVYAGVDPTARSLHIGHLIPLMCLLHFQIRGHKVLPLVSVFRVNVPSWHYNIVR